MPQRGGQEQAFPRDGAARRAHHHDFDAKAETRHFNSTKRLVTLLFAPFLFALLLYRHFAVGYIITSFLHFYMFLRGPFLILSKMPGIHDGAADARSIDAALFYFRLKRLRHFIFKTSHFGAR